MVCLFVCLRFCLKSSYPAEKITILTSYNGQKHLIRDVVKRRCGTNQAWGAPLKITTVDRYQGQQNDCIHEMREGGFFVLLEQCFGVFGV
jgi:superfamily I DNA and/or RNA helicase